MDITSNMVYSGAPDPSEPTVERMVPVPGFGQLFLMSDETAVYTPNNSLLRYSVSEKNLRKLERWITFGIGWRFLEDIPFLSTAGEDGTWAGFKDKLFSTWVPGMEIATTIQRIVDENTEVGGQL